MRKYIRSMTLLLVSVLLIGSLSACSKFDASGCLKAFLDCIYKNDQTAIVEMELITAEEGQNLHETRIEILMKRLLGTAVISEELDSEYRQLCEDIYSSVRYTVGETVEVDDETFEVSVTYEKMNVYTNAFDTYEEKLEEFVAQWTDTKTAGEEISDEEMMEHAVIAFKDCLVTSLANATFDAPETTTIRVELVDNVWSPNAEDLANFEALLLDFEGLE